MREEKRESTTVEMLCRLVRDEERRGTGIVLMGEGGIGVREGEGVGG